MDFGHNGKNVVVVGGTSGINQGIALGFAKAGANVCVVGRSQEKIDTTIELLKTETQGKVLGFSADVRNLDQVQSALEFFNKEIGDFDVLVSGAAGNFPALAKDLSENGFKSVIDIDLRGTFHVMSASYPFLRRPGASVINISAPQAFIPMQAQVHVCSAKAGVDMITRTLSLEWGPEKIRVNSIVPGPIDQTEGMKRLAPNEEMRTKTEKSVPLQRLGLPQDIANACLFLGSSFASYISGAIIPVDGGWSQSGCGGLGKLLEKVASKKEA